MPDVDGFAAECQHVARLLRRVPRDLRRDLARGVQEQVARPLAARISAAASGPYGPALSGAVKARAQADPTIVIGGARRVVSGGASARDLVYGVEFGGGKKVRAVARTARHEGYRRHTTNQFRIPHPFVFDTIGRSMDWVLDAFAELVIRVLERDIDG